MKHTDLSEIAAGSEFFNKRVCVCGWIRTARDSKNMAFLEINDGSVFEHMQIVINKASFSGELSSFMKSGAAVRAEGLVVPSAHDPKIPEIEAEKIELIGDCPNDYPLQKKRHSLEFLRTVPHLRLRSNTFNAVFRLRSYLAACVHEYFQSRGYLYINTPLITGSDCEGAGEMFKVTSIGYSDAYGSAEEYYSNDFFHRQAGLSVSGQLEGEAAACAFGKIYTFGPSFRAEESNTPRHAAEFWHIEPEVAFAELPDIMEIAEDMIKYLLSCVLDNRPQELAFFEKHYEEGLREKLSSVVKSKFAVVEYAEAVELLKKAEKDFTFPIDFGLDLQTEHERFLTDELFKKPVFVVNYPKDIKAFYMKQNPDGKTVAATDLLVPGVGEIIGCSEREAELEKLLCAIREKGMNEADYSDYLDLRRFGSVPHSGFGLGFERLLMYVTGMQNIRDVILYPRTAGNIR